MNKPEHSDPGGKAYLDLQAEGRRSQRTMQALMPMWISERWLARLSGSPLRHTFILKGGVLLAALGNRRPTQDADLLAVAISNDAAEVIALINEVAALELNDGAAFLTRTTTAATIREGDLYTGVRVTMDARIATAKVRLKLDINFGDPVTPAPEDVELPALLGGPPITVRGYPIVTVIAEKLSTAIQLGGANTRVRDYVDLYSLTGTYDFELATILDALEVTSAYRRVMIAPLSSVVGELVSLRSK